MRKNYRFTITYDGTRYHGWEAKPDVEMTVQGKLETVLSRMVEQDLYEGKPQTVLLVGAGRTDAGVHARKMTANSHLVTHYSEEEIRDYMNRYLPEDICVQEVKIVSDRFHSRYNATGKTYCYTCYLGPKKPVFDRKYVYTLEKNPDVEAMRAAAELLLGTHDFASFCGNPKMKKSTVRTLQEINIVQKGAYLKLFFKGDGFLQHMVRILTGTLLEVGYGKRKPESMTELLDAKKRAEAGFLAPAQGLCLMEVYYE